MELRTLEIYAAVAFVVLLGVVIVLSIMATAMKVREDTAKRQANVDPTLLQHLHARHDRLQHIAWIVAYLTAGAFLATLIARVIGAT
jgi:uncharacterized membrane protein